MFRVPPFLSVVVWTIMGLLVAMLVTQVIIPAVRGRVLFPLFRTQRKLESALAEVAQKEDEIELAQELETRSENLEMDERK